MRNLTHKCELKPGIQERKYQSPTEYTGIELSFYYKNRAAGKRTITANYKPAATDFDSYLLTWM